MLVLGNAELGTARKQATMTDEDDSEGNDALISLSYNPRRKKCNVMAIGNNDADDYHLVKFCNVCR